MSKNVWIVDDDSSIRFVLERTISQEGFKCRCFENGNDMLEAFKTAEPEIIISDIRMPGINGLDMLKKVHEKNPDIPVIITTAHSDLKSAVNSYQSGSFEYLPKPFDLDEVIAVIKKAEASLKEKVSSGNDFQENIDTDIIGESPAMQEVFRAIGRLSRSSISVLINGQSGTGKELVAHALHKHSIRANKPFIALNMAAIPKELIESELFGHEKGAFTGANATSAGRFEQANGGTLFLDEIGDMPLEAQTRLLRVLANGEFYRIGGHKSISVDVRIIAATNQNLEKMVADGKFREDLFYRLNVIRIHIPPLKDRSSDIPKLTKRFLNTSAKELNIETKILSPETEHYLCTLPWPGNVRQLENVCRWLTVMASGQVISINDLPPELLKNNNQTKLSTESSEQSENISGSNQTGKLPIDLSWQNLLRDWVNQRLHEGCTDILSEALPEFERSLIETALKYTHDHKQEAARLLGWGRNTLTRKLKELNFE